MTTLRTPTGPGRAAVLASGDRAWASAGQETMTELASLVRNHAKALRTDVGVDAVHDMRTATRRLRTAMSLHGQHAPKKQRVAVEDELKRVSRRLGAVRDLDILLQELDVDELDTSASDLKPLGDAWRAERSSDARRLTDELERRRFRRATQAAKRLVTNADEGGDREPGSSSETDRVATQAPALIWDAFGSVLTYEVDPMTADPDAIHQLRIAAKKLRYTLEAFEEALEPGATLIAEVTALQEAAGSMHDAIVAADRSRSTLDPGDLTKRQRQAIDAFAGAQDRKAERLRPSVARHLRAIRSRAFRESLGRAVAGMGHVRAVEKRQSA